MVVVDTSAAISHPHIASESGSGAHAGLCFFVVSESTPFDFSAKSGSMFYVSIIDWLLDEADSRADAMFRRRRASSCGWTTCWQPAETEEEYDMKWPEMAANWGRHRKTGLDLAVFVKMISMLMVGSVMFFVAFGVLGFIHAKYATTTPSSSMKGMAASVSSQFFMDMMGMEVPGMARGDGFTFSQANVASFLFAMLTDLSPHDPKTLLAREVPGMAQDRPVVLTSPSGTSDGPLDYGPKGGVIGGDKVGEAGTITANPQFPDPQGPSLPESEPAAEPPKTAGKNVAFIYQTHNQESYLPELPGVTDPDKAYDPEKNVTLVGLRLAQMLEKEGIGAVHSNKNYPAIEPNFNYNYSYKYSFKTLQEASVAHPDLKFYFDIHRDSQRRDKTTIKLNGQDYAQVYFIIGGKNKHWQANHDFAEQIHRALEQKYPGVSKGIYAKGGEGNGLYNQQFSPNTVLIEVGGVDNTLEECYRTVDALAVAIAEVINNVEKVDAPAGPEEDAKQG